MSHTWPFFNAQFANAETSHGADHVRLVGNSSGSQSPYEGSPASSQVNLNSKDQRRLSLQQNHVKSFDRADTMKTGPSVAQKGYRTFYPGDYLYNFELPIDSRLPESIDVDLGSVKYELEATVERAGAFRGNLVGMKPIVMIRAPAEGSLEQTEPIAISRNWEDQLHYDIVISGKSFPLGSKVPIAFKLTPLAKVQLHRVKVFVTENTEYFCSNKRVHRMEPTRKVLLFEKRADGPSISTFPGSTMRITAGGGVPYEQREAAARGEEVVSQDSSNLLGRLAGEANVGPTEMEFSVQLPGCHHSTEKDRVNRLHFDTTYQNIQVHHWIKASIVERLLPCILLTATRLSCGCPSRTRTTQRSAGTLRYPSIPPSTSSPAVLARPTSPFPPTHHQRRRTTCRSWQSAAAPERLDTALCPDTCRRSLLSRPDETTRPTGRASCPAWHDRSRRTSVDMTSCSVRSTCSARHPSTRRRSMTRNRRLRSSRRRRSTTTLRARAAGWRITSRG